ncbi:MULTISPECIES: VOC family protein [unclassified Arthrobacter]|uniref:VOC family protein n=1 Tax=unclassified Arthrobacter TaxID=235627 RepID=UPI00159E6B25|nr:MULTISPECIES: VOC family protein [unclassified Arthrobacter]MCQ9166118.1 VOC family protein [Arthrobacter sp. STN4]NVN00602.1 VOC family protein [Arthrobacter sp. SDTb3-6]
MNNPVNYFEIGSPDPEAASAFYSGLFGWPVGPPSEGSYSMVDGGKGGLWDTSTMGAGTWAIFYVQVDDVAAGIDKAVGLGARVVVPRVDNGTIQFAHLEDPQGNRFGIWHPNAG